MSTTIHEETVYCPLLLREINEELCDDAANVAEGFHPERFAPKEIRDVPNWKDVCRECKNNPYNE